MNEMSQKLQKAKHYDKRTRFGYILYFLDKYKNFQTRDQVNMNLLYFLNKSQLKMGKKWWTHCILYSTITFGAH